MSVQAMTAVFENSEATSNARNVLMSIANHADIYGIAWPGIEAISHEARCGQRTVQRALLSLEKAGELYVYERAGQSNVYRIRLVGIRSLDKDGRQKLSECRVSDPRHSDTPPNARANGTRTIKNHQEEDLEPLPGAKKARARDEVFEALVDACGLVTQDLTVSSRGALNKAVRQLKDVGATPEEIKKRARRYRDTYPNSTLTPTALAKHWPQMGRAQTSSRYDQQPTQREDEPGCEHSTPMCAECREAAKERVREMVNAARIGAGL